jgi:hypothetical protein
VDDVFLGGVAEGVGEFEEFRGDPMGHGGDPCKGVGRYCNRAGWKGNGRAGGALGQVSKAFGQVSNWSGGEGGVEVVVGWGVVRDAKRGVRGGHEFLRVLLRAGARCAREGRICAGAQIVTFVNML